MTESKYCKLIELYMQRRNIEYTILSITTSDFKINNLSKEDCLKHLDKMQILIKQEIYKLEREVA